MRPEAGEKCSLTASTSPAGSQFGFQGSPQALLSADSSSHSSAPERTGSVCKEAY